MFKLGTMVNDKVTQLRGMLTHLQIEGTARMYLFQPHGLNPETQEPADHFWIAPERVRNGVEIPEPDMHRAVLGTEVEDEASGFKGIAIALVLHINGCVHVEVQPSGTLKKTGGKIKRHDFDIRRLKGKAIKKMSEAEIETSQQRSPSPAHHVRLRD